MKYIYLMTKGQVNIHKNKLFCKKLKYFFQNKDRTTNKEQTKPSKENVEF